MKLTRILILSAGVALAISGAVPLLERIFADSKPAVQLKVKNAQPREVEDVTQTQSCATTRWRGRRSARHWRTIRFSP